jgi:hypothetical protein
MKTKRATTFPSARRAVAYMRENNIDGQAFMLLDGLAVCNGHAIADRRTSVITDANGSEFLAITYKGSVILVNANNDPRLQY